jgi:hypothetical protein
MLMTKPHLHPKDVTTKLYKTSKHETKNLDRMPHHILPDISYPDLTLQLNILITYLPVQNLSVYQFLTKISQFAAVVCRR